MECGKIRKGRGGFTLTELIVSFAILAVISIIVALIIQATGGTYSSITTDINLQYESQTAMNTIQEYLIDCNDTVVAPQNAGELYIYKKNPAGSTDGAYSSYKVVKSPTSNELLVYYGHNDPSNADFSAADKETLSSYVQSFTAAINEDTRKSITLTIVYRLGSKTYTGTQTIAFRNRVNAIP